MPDKVWLYSIRSVAVSYTHLDVYKRQDISSPKARVVLINNMLSANNKIKLPLMGTFKTNTERSKMIISVIKASAR